MRIKLLKTTLKTQKLSFLSLLLLLSMFTTSTSALAQTDTCTTPPTLTVNTSCITTAYNVTSAFSNDGPTPCTGTSHRDGWYTFTTGASTTSVTITGTSNRQMGLAVYSGSGSCNTLTQVGCTVPGTANANLVATVLPNTTYRLRIMRTNNATANVMTGTICVFALASPPINNDCSSATSLIVNSNTTCGTSTNGNTVGATQSQAGCAGTADDDVWYSFNATSSSHTVTVTPNTLSDAVLQVFSGTCGSLTSLACVDSTFGSGTETTTLSGLTAGITYFVRVHSWSNASGNGTFSICVTTPPPPINPCSSIATISACNSTENLFIPAGNGSYNPSSCLFSTPGNEIIYSFTPTVSGVYTISQTTSYAFIDYQIKTAASGCGPTGWTCIDDLLGNATSIGFSMTAGVSYLLLLDPEFSTTGGVVTFTINCPAPPVTNDECSNAIPLTISPSCTFSTYSNAGATASAGIPAPGCSLYSGGDVWFSVVVPANGSIRIDTSTGTVTDGGMAVYRGNCGALTLVECDDDDSANGLMPFINLTGQTPGTTLYVRFWEFGNDNNGTFEICVTSPVPCVPGPGLGNSNTGCPIVTAGGLGLNGADPLPINPCLTATCVSLEANYIALGETTSYSVTSIPYSPPPYQFNCLANPVSVNIDDVWSPVINLPFNFCFYGNTYNSCIMGSNGMLSFNTANANGSSGWRFDENLPSVDEALFANTIYGVYHDIDPSVGGEVGWELVTLATGCRALVAAWNDVPMFSNNSILYTGMIIMYESTNIIEVFIKEKRVDNNNVNPWNGGNAVVGIQNSTGTQAAVAPGRNSLDTNWTATQEAWRFVPNGTPITTVRWFEGSGTAGPLVGTTNTINVCPSATTTYTVEIAYDVCPSRSIITTDEVTVTVVPNKIWNGSIDSDWNKNNNWTPIGIPTGTDCVIIPVTPNNPLISGSGYNGLAGNLTVYNNATLNISADTNLTVTDFIAVNTGGNIVVANSGSIIQINNAINTGIINYSRNANVRTLDYVYWSSPVANQNINSLFTPIVAGPQYEWNTTIANPNGGQGNWVLPTTTNMDTGKGYIIRGPSASPFNNSTTNILTARFIGTPNNGIITVPIFRGSDTNTAFHTGLNGIQITNYSDNWNLLGNPYPSSIRGSQFLFDNRTKLEGNIRLWTHGNLPVFATNPFYSSFLYNYSAGDYLTFNFTGTTCCPAFPADLFIASGQGFFVQMVDGSAGSDFVTFNNSLRSASYTNANFYRQTESNEIQTEFDVTNLERNRIWLDIVNQNSISERTLLGYIEGATMEKDSFFDCVTQNMGSMGIYSLLNDVRFSIQGRALPFNDEDVVPIGVEIPNSGSYSIAIAGLDGLFESQAVYIKDKMTNSFHDIKNSPYLFSSIAGIHNERFEVVYKTNSLGNNEFEAKDDIKVIYQNNILLQATKTIKTVKVYNTLGQLINTYNDINSNEIELNLIPKNNTTWLLKIELDNGIVIGRKVVF